MQSVSFRLCISELLFSICGSIHPFVLCRTSDLSDTQSNTVLCGPLISRHGAASSFGVMTRSAERKGNYECVADSQEEVVFQLES
jgi:hypothetical protein